MFSKNANDERLRSKIAHKVAVSFQTKAACYFLFAESFRCTKNSQNESTLYIITFNEIFEKIFVILLANVIFCYQIFEKIFVKTSLVQHTTFGVLILVRTIFLDRKSVV